MRKKRDKIGAARLLLINSLNLLFNSSADSRNRERGRERENCIQTTAQYSISGNSVCTVYLQLGLTPTHIVENLVSFSSLDHVELVGVLYGVMTELGLDCGEVNAGLLRLKATATWHVSITIDSTGERENTSILYFLSNHF